jgi:hypothetical protein
MSEPGGDKLSLYLHDLGELLKEEALIARSESQKAAIEDRSYARDEAMAFYRVISLMQQQARAFGIDLDVIALSDIDPDRDLL